MGRLCANPHIDRVANDRYHETVNEHDAIVVIFGKEQVRRRKIGHFLKHYGEDVLPRGPELARLMGRFHFLIGGYDDHPEEVYAISEIRRFYRFFLNAWPAWFFFCDLETEGLQMMTTCCLEEFNALKREGSPSVQVALDPLHLLSFINGRFPAMNLMFERAGLPESAIEERTDAIMRYYNMR